MKKLTEKVVCDFCNTEVTTLCLICGRDFCNQHGGTKILNQGGTKGLSLHVECCKECTSGQDITDLNEKLILLFDELTVVRLTHFNERVLESSRKSMCTN